MQRALNIRALAGQDRSRYAEHRYAVRYVVYDPKDPRKGRIISDATLGQIVLGEGLTITKALAAASRAAQLSSGTVVWDREQARVAYRVP